MEATRQLQAAASHEGAMRGKLRLGVIETVVHSWLADYMRRLADDFPQLEVELAVDVSVVLQRRLMAGELDLIIRVEGSDEESVVCDALANYPVHWIARAGLLPLSRSGLAKRVLRHPILTFGRGTAPHRALEDIVGKLALANGVPLADTRITGSPSIFSDRATRARWVWRGGDSASLCRRPDRPRRSGGVAAAAFAAVDRGVDVAPRGCTAVRARRGETRRCGMSMSIASWGISA